MMNTLPLLLLLQAASNPGLGVEFKAPAGWQAVEATPFRAFAPTGLQRGQALLLAVWPAERIAGPHIFRSWFETKLSSPGETVLQQSALDHRPANGLDVLTVTQRVNLPQVGPVVRVVYGINAGERVAVAMVTTNQDQLITTYTSQAREFFESLRFPATATATVGRTLAAIPPAGFDGNTPRGLFYRLQTGGGFRMETRARIFLPSNRMLRIDPAGGGNTIDLGRCSPDTCGSYQIEGGWLTVRWDNGDIQRLSYTRSGEGFTLDGDTFQPARGLDRSEAIGRWGNPGAASAGLELRADGTFEWGAGTSATTLHGRYELKGLSLVLHFSDGTSQEYALFAAGRTRPAGLISVDGAVYNRR
jgi:hypothetical protein